MTIIRQMMKNWQTTSSGILMIVGGICGLCFAPAITEGVVMASATAIVGGIGLMFAKVQSVTGGTKQQ